MIKIPFNSNTLFSALLAFFFVVIIYRVTPPSVDEVLELVFSKNRGHIANIDQPRSISETRNFMIDRLKLRERNLLSHPKLGAMVPWHDDFYVDMTTVFEVKNTDTYYFMVGSDDGFKLQVDGRELCKFPGDRAYVEQRCSARLSEGKHTLVLNYFQGYGHSGLTLQYRKGNDGKQRYWGEESRDIKILPTKK